MCVLLVALVVAGAWSQTLTFMTNGVSRVSDAEAQFRYKNGVLEEIIARFAVANKIKVNVVTRDVSKGSLTFDAMLAAGNPPDVWMDAGSYMVNYMNDDYALQLEKYLNLKDYDANLLALWTVNGHVYCIPFQNIATGMAVNLDMLKQIGYTLPELAKWTTDEFLSLAAKLKDAGIPATMIMGKGGMNSWTNVWLQAFGAAMFKPGDFSRVTVNSPQALTALAYIKRLADNGYCPPPLEVNDDDGVEMFTTNKVFSCLMQNGHADGWFPEQVKAKKIAVEPDYTFIEFPHAAGRAHTPVSGYQTVVLTHKSKSEATNKLVAALALEVSGREAQFQYCTTAGGFPTIKGFVPETGTAAKPSYKAIAKLANEAGVYKDWPDGPKGLEVRRVWYTLSEQWLRGKSTDAVFLSQFETEANAVLAKK
jgi:ABC-type glycerol-3-phosphate transport system substrate-binding protein